MAEKKTIELEIKSNLNVAEKQLKDLGDAIKIVDKEATNLDATFEEIYGDIKPLTAQMGELEDRLYELAKAGKQNTKEYQDLLREVGKYKRIQQETDKVVDAAAQTMSSKLSGSLNAAAGGFSLVQGSMALFGAESTQVEEAILKVQAAMAISQGVQTIQEGAKSVTALGNSVKSYTIVQKIITAGQWLWNAAMSANPIGLLIAGIAALIAGGIALTNYFKSNAIAAEKNAASIKANKTALESQSKAADSASKSLQTNYNYQLEMAKATGASTAAIRKLELKLIDEKIAFADSSREIAKNTYHKNLNALASLKAADADEEQIKLQEEITRKSLEEFGKQTKNLNDANAEKGNIIRKQNVEIRQEQTNHNNELRNKNKEASTKAKEDAIAAAKELEEERQALIGKQGERARDEYEASEKLIKDAKKANEDALKTENQIKVEKENADFELKKQSLLQKGLSIEEIEKEHKRKLAELDTEYFASEADKGIKSTADAKAQSDAKIAIAQKEKEGRIQAADAAANTLSGLSELLGKETAAGKAAAVASATINTFSSAQKAYDSTVGIPFVGPVLAPINAGLAIAAGIKNVKSILAVKTPGGGGGSAPSGGGGGASTPAAPAFNVVGASPTNQIAQTIANQQQQPIKAYVVSNDVTTAQSLDRNIISSASIG
jgi:hypothetical protein